MGTVRLDPYNYAHFDEYVRSGADIEEFTAFPNRLHVGETAPDFVATDLADASPVRMSTLWRRRTAVIEFGSFT